MYWLDLKNLIVSMKVSDDAAIESAEFNVLIDMGMEEIKINLIKKSEG